MSKMNEVIIVLAFCFVGISSKNNSIEDVQEIPDKYKRYFEVNDFLFSSNIAMGEDNGKKLCCNVDIADCPDEVTARPGSIVHSLKAWYYIDTVIALQVGLSDDTFCTYGTPDHQISETFVIAPGERIASLKLWANDETGQFGGFALTTDQNRHFGVNDKHYNNMEPFQPEIGSGILVGAFGMTNSADVACLGFALLRRGSAEMIDVTYPDLSIVPDIKPKQIQSIMYDNSNSTAEEQFAFKGSEEVTSSQFWSLPGGLESSIPLKVQAGVPIIELTESAASWKVSVATTHNVSNVRITKQSYEFPLIAPAGKRLKATAILYEGNIKVQYTASILCTLVSGKQFSYDITGIYKGIAVSEISVTAERF